MLTLFCNTLFVEVSLNGIQLNLEDLLFPHVLGSQCPYQ